MNELLPAIDARAITESATSKQIEKEKIEAENKWLLNLKFVNDKLNERIVEINSMIGAAAEKTKYDLSFVISMNDLTYADEFNFYNHLIFQDFDREKLQIFIDVFASKLNENNYSGKTVFKTNIGLSPKLKTTADEDYFILEVSWGV